MTTTPINTSVSGPCPPTKDDTKLSTPRPAAPLVLRLAELARRKHYYCEDGWYSCPKNPDGCANDGMGPDCNCGADQINAEVDAILSELVPNTGREAR